MFGRFHVWLHGIPWGRAGTAILVLAGLVEFLDQLSGIDITPVVRLLGYDPAVIIAAIGILKIALRVVLSMIPPPPPPPPPSVQ